jgi:Fe2+ transport system protein FeoA
MKTQVSLAAMRKGQSGTVVGVVGGRGMIRRLEPLGIRPGQRIKKASQSFMRGPVTVRVGNASVAIGFGMATRIQVELESEENQ